jgi:Mg2+ and Co2+ transporter CorA
MVAQKLERKKNQYSRREQAWIQNNNGKMIQNSLNHVIGHLTIWGI